MGQMPTTVADEMERVLETERFINCVRQELQQKSGGSPRHPGDWNTSQDHDPGHKILCNHVEDYYMLRSLTEKIRKGREVCTVIGEKYRNYISHATMSHSPVAPQAAEAMLKLKELEQLDDSLSTYYRSQNSRKEDCEKSLKTIKENSADIKLQQEYERRLEIIEEHSANIKDLDAMHQVLSGRQKEMKNLEIQAVIRTYNEKWLDIEPSLTGASQAENNNGCRLGSSIIPTAYRHRPLPISFIFPKCVSNGCNKLGHDYYDGYCLDCKIRRRRLKV